MGTKRNVLQAGLTAGTVVCLLFACTNTSLLRPLEPGTTIVETQGSGIVFGRVAVMRDGEDQLCALPAFPKEFGWVLSQAETGKGYVVSPLTENGIFALELPAGTYEVSKLMYEERAGLWEGSVPAAFSVKAGKSVYLGTWRLEFLNLGPSSRMSGQVVDQSREAAEDLKQNYPALTLPVSSGLLASSAQGYLSLVRPRAEQ